MARLSAIRHWLGLAQAGTVVRGPWDELRDQLRRDVANGFLDEEAILDNVRDLIAELAAPEPPEAMWHEARRLLYEALADHLEAEQGWAAVTDCDRLDAAFAALEADGIIARQNLRVGEGGGSAAIRDELRAAEEGGQVPRGHVYYHRQDIESAVKGHILYLTFGARGRGSAAQVKIGHDIVARLAQQGLRTHWAGAVPQRIGVSVDWKKRRQRPPVAN